MKPKKFKNHKQLQKYLRKFDFQKYKVHDYAGVYFLMYFGDEICPVFFEEYDGYYFECLCDVKRFPLKKKKLKAYVKEHYKKKARKKALSYEKLMQSKKWHYEIVCWQSVGFLPEKTEILAVLTETECLRVLMNLEKLKKSSEILDKSGKI